MECVYFFAKSLQRFVFHVRVVDVKRSVNMVSKATQNFL